MLDASCLEHRSYPASCDPPHALWTGLRLGLVVGSEGTRAVFRRDGHGLPRERVEVLAQGTCRSAGPRCRAGSLCVAGAPLWLRLSRALAFSLRLPTCSRRWMQAVLGFAALPTGGRLFPFVAVSVFAVLLPVSQHRSAVAPGSPCHWLTHLCFRRTFPLRSTGDRQDQHQVSWRRPSCHPGGPLAPHQRSTSLFVAGDSGDCCSSLVSRCTVTP